MRNRKTRRHVIIPERPRVGILRPMKKKVVRESAPQIRNVQYIVWEVKVRW
jgi:hypothetical protein